MIKLRQLLVSTTKIQFGSWSKSVKQSPCSRILLIAALVLNLDAIVKGQEVAMTEKGRERVPIVVFVCEHGAAKSVIAAAYFNKLARERKLQVRAISRGTKPDKEIGKQAAEGLVADGLVANREKPQRLSNKDVSISIRVVAFCELPQTLSDGVRVDQWNDAPSVSEDYNRARDWILERVKLLIDELK